MSQNPLARATIANANIKIHIKLEMPLLAMLPSHVQMAHVLLFIDHVMGGHFDKAALEMRQSDHLFELAAGSKFRYRFIRHLCFTDLIHQRHAWEIKEDDPEGLRLVPISDGLSLALSYRLLKFFGGKLWLVGPFPNGPCNFQVQHEDALFQPLPDSDIEAQLRVALSCEPELALSELIVRPPNDGEENYHQLFLAMQSLERRSKLNDLVRPSMAIASRAAPAL